MKEKTPVYKNHREIILLWGKRSCYAAAIDVPDKTAQSHYDRNSIGYGNLKKVVDAAAKIGHPEVTLDMLMELKPVRRRIKCCSQ
jgi:hypothetical protein